MRAAEGLGFGWSDLDPSEAIKNIVDAAGNFVDKINQEALKPIVDPIAEGVSRGVDHLGPVGSALKQTFYLAKGEMIIVVHPAMMVDQLRDLNKPGQILAAMAAQGGASAKQIEQLGRIGDTVGAIVDSTVRGIVTEAKNLTVAQGQMYMDLARGDFSGALKDFEDGAHAAIKLGITAGAIVAAAFTGGATLIILTAAMSVYKAMDSVGVLPLWLSPSDGKAKENGWWVVAVDMAGSLLPAIAPAAGSVLGAAGQSGALASSTAVSELAKASSTVSSALAELNSAASVAVEQITAITAYVQEVAQHLPGVLETYQALQMVGIDMVTLTKDIVRADYKDLAMSAGLSMARNYGLPVDVMDDYLAEVGLQIKDLKNLDNIHDRLASVTTQYLSDTYLGQLDPDAVRALSSRDYQDCIGILATKYGTQFVDREQLLVGTGLTVDDVKLAIKGKPPAPLTALQTQYVQMAQAQMAEAKQMAEGILGQNAALIKSMAYSTAESIARMGAAQVAQAVMLDQTLESNLLPGSMQAPAAGVILPGGNMHAAMAKYDLARTRGASQLVKAEVAKFQASRVIDTNVALIATRDSRIQPNAQALAKAQADANGRVAATKASLDQAYAKAQASAAQSVQSAIAWAQTPRVAQATEALLSSRRQAVNASRDATLATLSAATKSLDQFTTLFG